MALGLPNVKGQLDFQSNCMHILHCTCILRKFIFVLYKIDFVNHHLHQADRDCEAFGVTLCFDIFPYKSLFSIFDENYLRQYRSYRRYCKYTNNKRFKFQQFQQLPQHSRVNPLNNKEMFDNKCKVLLGVFHLIQRIIQGSLSVAIYIQNSVYLNLISRNINVQNPLEFFLTIHVYC